MNKTALPWHLYIVLCSDNTLYTGVTNDLDKRIAKHNAGTGAKYTKGRGPVRLVHTETHTDRPSAQKREAAIKKLSKSEKLALIQLL